MRNIKFIITSVLLLGLNSTGFAAACDTSVMPDSLYELIKESKYDEAVQLAKADYQKQNKNKESSFVLAKVYVNATIHSGMSFDMTKLGFKKGESGKKKITLDQLKSANKSRTIVNKKYLKETETFILKTIKKWPETNGLLFCLTKIHFYNRDHSRFIKLLAQTADAHKSSKEETVDFLIGYGAEYLKNNRYELAADVYSTLLKTFPKSAPVLSTLGVTYSKRGHTKIAMRYFDKAYKISPDDIIIIGNIAESSMLLADFKKADKFLNLRAKHYPNKAEIYFDLAINAMPLNPKKSTGYWEKYFKIDAKYPDDKTWSSNAKVIQDAVKDTTYTEYDWFNLGAQMIQKRVPKYAVALMSYANSKHPYDASISYGLSHAYDSGEHYDLEEKALLDTLKRLKHPKNKFKKDPDDIYYNLSRCALNLGRVDDTEAYLRKIKTDSKLSANSDYMFGLVYQRREMKKKSLNYFKSCSKKTKSSSLKKYCEGEIAKYR